MFTLLGKTYRRYLYLSAAHKCHISGHRFLQTTTTNKVATGAETGVYDVKKSSDQWRRGSISPSTSRRRQKRKQNMKASRRRKKASDRC